MTLPAAEATCPGLELPDGGEGPTLAKNPILPA
jgi:hypothetical protein